MFRSGLLEIAKGACRVVGVAIFVLGAAAECGDVAAQVAQLALEVKINGYDTRLIGNFVMRPDQSLAATRKELRELGLEPGAGEDAETIALHTIDGLTYSYDAERQAVDVTAPNRSLKIQELGPQRFAEPPASAPANALSAVINYGLTVSHSDGPRDRGSSVWPFAWTNLASLSLDTRLVGSWGTLANSGVLGSGLEGNESVLRLDTTWSWSDPRNVWTWAAGDITTRSLAWSRPIRLGGLQWRTNFALRPDVVTVPQPQFSGSAAVPSSVDVFINNTKTYSGDVAPGPFLITNIPGVTGAGEARIVVRDAAGRESVQTTSFFASPALLRGGIFEHSVEVGVARSNYGRVSDDYDERPALSASLRYGYSNSLTLEGHVEGMKTLANAGIGVSTTVFDWAALSMAASFSQWEGASGFLLYAALQTKIGPASVSLSSRRTFGSYNDLASVVPHESAASIAAAWTHETPRVLDIVSLSTPLGNLDGNISFNFIHRETDTDATRLLSAGYSRQLLGTNTVFVSGFHVLGSKASMIFAGLSIPLGELGHIHAGASTDGAGTYSNLDYAKAAEKEPGSVGWRASVRRGVTEANSGAITYQSSVARLEAGVDQIGAAARLHTYADGALVVSTRGPMLSNRIDDAFAVVDVGHPGVPVMLENRVVAVTKADGVALVPGLRSYEKNRISIDPDRLPADVTVSEVRTVAVPADRSGVTIQFAARQTGDSAVVIFQRPDTGFIEPGAEGIVEGSQRTFLVGYDGRAYLEGLTEFNRVTITTAAGTCDASFPFKAAAGALPPLPKAVCQ